MREKEDNVRGASLARLHSSMLNRKISIHGFIAGGIILVSLLLRLVLVGLGWPLTNSDEGVWGIMALHIAYHGDHPLFYYGQHYMGSWEAFLGALFFRLLGPSLFTLRLVTISAFAIFLLSIYLLTRLLFTRTYALITLLLVGLGSGFVISVEILVYGGYAETLAFSALLFLGASWLALTYRRQGPTQQVWRWIVYLGWGLVAGLGLWIDQLILPAICGSGLLILIICWRELLSPLPLFSLLVGTLFGAAPLIDYNLHAPRSQSSLAILARLRSPDGVSLYTTSAILKELHGTFQISVPMMTGEPFCPVSEFLYLAPSSPHTLACSIAHGGWSLSYLLLLAISCVLAGWGIWRVWRKKKQIKDEPALQIELRRQLVRLLLLLSALITLVSYTFSNSPQTVPAATARYLIFLLVITPVVFWPLWQGLQTFRTRTDFVGRALRGFCAIALLCFCGSSLLGSILAFTEVPAAAAMNQNDANLIQELQHLGVTGIYTNYWTCGKIAFESDEHILCVVLNSQMQTDPVPSHNRYHPYILAVHTAHKIAYVFSTDPAQFPASGIYRSLIDPTAPIASLPEPYRSNFVRIELNSYIIYLPQSSQ